MHDITNRSYDQLLASYLNDAVHSLSVLPNPPHLVVKVGSEVTWFKTAVCYCDCVILLWVN